MKLMDKNKTTVNVPANLKLVIWRDLNIKKNLNVFVYNESKKINLTFNLSKIKFNYDFWSNSITIENNSINNINNKISKTFYNFLKSWNIYFFLKIKFKGKGFRIRFLKKLKLVKFFFGRSHKTFVLFKSIKIKKINKYKFILTGIKKTNLIHNKKIVLKIKPVNLYTLRGIRNSRQIIFKRKGKKGTYI